MNCFMGYNPLVTKQVKVTVWVCEQDGATPVAPSNPSEGDCFIVYATDEAVLSNSPTSAKSYTSGEWADTSSGGGGDFATATMTLVNNSTNTDLIINGAVVLDVEGYASTTTQIHVTTGQEEREVILYKGEALVYRESDTHIVSISGDITDDGDGYYVVTGDCTFTLSDPA